MLLGLGLYIGNQTSNITASQRDAVIMQSKNIIRHINRNDYIQCLNLFDPELRASMGLKKMQDVFTPALKALGEFQRFTGAYIDKYEKDGVTYTAAHVKCKYKNENALFTILFNSDNKISGIQLD